MVTHEETRELPGERDNARNNMPGARKRGRPRTAWMDNIKTWTGLSVEESIRMTEDRDKWRKYVSMVWPTLGSRTAKEQNRFWAIDSFVPYLCQFIFAAIL